MALDDILLDYSRLAEALLRPVLAAGAAQMRHYAAGVEVHAKADLSPVTIADRESEAILIKGIEAAAPGVAVVAEEAVSEGRIPEIGQQFFLVDPLDGTREFINRRGEFTVNVALIDAGRPCFGIVYAPALGDLYVTLGARHGGRATIQPTARDATLDACGLRPIETRPPNRAALVAVASRSHLTPETEAFLGRYPISARHDSGSSLKFCAIARGDADIYPRLGPTMEWDTAAGHAVLLAAGGCVTELDGRPLRYGNSLRGFRNPHFVAWGTPGPIPAAA